MKEYYVDEHSAAKHYVDTEDMKTNQIKATRDNMENELLSAKTEDEYAALLKKYGLENQ